jgi:hypothetical protein
MRSAEKRYYWLSLGKKVLGFDFLKESLILICSLVIFLNMWHLKDFLVHDGFIFKGNQLYIPEGILRLKIIQEMHNEG